jgi:hypothetical protein
MSLNSMFLVDKLVATVQDSSLLWSDTSHVFKRAENVAKPRV